MDMNKKKTSMNYFYIRMNDGYEFNNVGSYEGHQIPGFLAIKVGDLISYLNCDQISMIQIREGAEHGVQM